MHQCQYFFIVFSHALSNDGFRFKRVGPNAMRGRGIGTARGRATIMRGMPFILSHIDSTSTDGPYLFAANGMLIQIMVSLSMTLILCLAARRGRGVPAARGIRR